MDPSYNNMYLYKKGAERDVNPCGERGRDWSDVAISQGKPRIAGSHWKPEEARKDCSLTTSEGCAPLKLSFSPGILILEFCPTEL